MMKLQSKIVPLFLLLVNLGYGQIQGGTCVFIQLFPGSIVAAADTKSAIWDTLGNVVRDMDVCKIHRGNQNTFFAYSGRIPFDTTREFDQVASIAYRACAEGKEINEIAELFKAYSLDSIDFDMLSTINSRHYQKRKDFIEIAFFGFEEGVVTSCLLSYGNPNIFLERDTSLVRKEYFRATTYPHRLVLGARDKIEKFLSTHHGYVSGNTDIIKARLDRLIKLEAAANPNRVGGEIVILGITAKTHTWLQNKNACKNF